MKKIEREITRIKLQAEREIERIINQAGMLPEHTNHETNIAIAKVEKEINNIYGNYCPKNIGISK